jgi:uncharacterized membrane protein SpoIIM required for sporulation
VAVINMAKVSEDDMDNPLILFLYRLCQIGFVVSFVAYLLLAAVIGFAVAPKGQEDFFAISSAVLAGVFLAITVLRDHNKFKS